MSENSPTEVLTKALVREVDLGAFGFAGTLALITLDNGADHNRPNTFGVESLAHLHQAVLECVARKPAAIAITGKPFVFAAGADLSALAFISDREEALAIGKLGHKVFRQLGELDIPTFAFINGIALGGGLELALHCTYRTLASTALTALPEVFLGLVPGWGGATLLPKLIGPEAAVQVIILNPLANNTMMKAREALTMGVVDAVFEPVDFLEKSMAFAANILKGSQKIERVDYSADGAAWERALARGEKAALKKYGGAVIEAPHRALALIAASQSASRDSGFDLEDTALADLTLSDPLRASLYAFNLIQKGRKKVAGAPKPALARKITRVGVVGAGLMASQLALLMVKNLACPVMMTDIEQSRVDKGVAWVHGELLKLVEKKRMSAETAQKLIALVTGSTDQNDFAQADFIVEAIYEELSLKQELFQKLEKIVSLDCILATNTSSLSVEKMSAGLAHPERVIGFHVFNPVALMPLLEISRTQFTDDATVATAIELGKNLKKTMVIAKDAPGFVANRLLTRFMSEITDAMDEGTPLEIADGAMRKVGFPMSVFQLVGLVGPGVVLHITEILNANLGERFRISPTVRGMVENNVKSFYLKDSEGELTLNPLALALIKKGNNPSTAEEVRLRAFRGLTEEAQMMIEEGVVSSPQEIDLCMLLGAGWPLHLGGILPYLDREGFSEEGAGKRFHPKGVASLP